MRPTFTTGCVKFPKNLQAALLMDKKNSSETLSKFNFTFPGACHWEDISRLIKFSHIVIMRINARTFIIGLQISVATAELTMREIGSKGSIVLDSKNAEAVIVFCSRSLRS